MAVFDLDGTLTTHDTFRDFLVRAFLRMPTRWPLAPLFLSAAVRLKIGRMDNGQCKSRFLALLFKGAGRRTLEALGKAHADRVAGRIRPGAARTLDAFRSQGALLVLATASPDIYVREVAKKLGFDEVVCTETGFDAEGTFTGELVRGNCRGENKVRMLGLRFPDRSEWTIHAFTDHHSDMPLLEWADVPVAVSPTPPLRKAALARDIAIADWSH